MSKHPGSINNDSITSQIRSLVTSQAPRVWQLEDFSVFPRGAAAQALSRLCREGVLQRKAKGLYYRAERGTFGLSSPSSSEVSETTSKHRLDPAGLSAANLLGFTTQNPARPQYASTGASKPQRLSKHKVFTRRSPARENLTVEEGAMLEFIRARGEWSELTPHETVHRLLILLEDRRTFERLADASMTEPPRVRAILGAIGQQLNQSRSTLLKLRNSLNALTKFDFGALRALRHSKEWQAK